MEKPLVDTYKLNSYDKRYLSYAAFVIAFQHDYVRCYQEDVKITRWFTPLFKLSLYKIDFE